MKMNMSSTVLLFAIKELINLRWAAGLFGGSGEDKCCLSPITVHPYESLSEIGVGERERYTCREQQNRMSQAWQRQPLLKACLGIEAIFRQIFCSIMQRERFLTDKFKAVWFGCSEMLQKLL